MDSDKKRSEEIDLLADQQGVDQRAFLIEASAYDLWNRRRQRLDMGNLWLPTVGEENPSRGFYWPFCPLGCNEWWVANFIIR